jgi:hypothetical protein
MRHFSEYQFAIKKLAKKHGITWEQLAHTVFSKRNVPNLVAANADPHIAQQFNAVMAEYSALKYGCNHYFVTGQGMEEWLSTAAPPLTKEKLASLPPYQEGGSNVCIIHFEGTKSGCYLVSFGVDGTVMVDGTPQLTDIKTIWIAKKEFEKPEHLLVFCREDKLENVTDLEMKQCINVVSGLFSYMECFPDAVKQGVPEDIKHPAHFKGIEGRTVDGSQVIGERGAVTPHFRNGHFRVLRSERFTKKRYQVIFIKECFVKGRAATVLGLDDVTNPATADPPPASTTPQSSSAPPSDHATGGMTPPHHGTPPGTQPLHA